MLGSPKIPKPNLPYTSQVASFAKDQGARSALTSAIGSGGFGKPSAPPSAVTPASIAAQRQGGRQSMVISRAALLGGQ